MATTTAAQGLSPRHDGFHLDPPLYYPPTPQLRGGALVKTMPSFPFYPPPTGVRFPHIPEENAGQLMKVDVSTPSPSPSSTRKEAVDTAFDLPLSDQVHILGFTQQSKFIAHAVAAIPRIPPVRLFVHHPLMLTRWGEEGRHINLLDAEGHHISSHEVLCPDLVGPLAAGLRLPRCRNKPKKSNYLDNLIVSTASWSTVSALKHLRHRVDRRTTVCLLHRGLGLMEWLNKMVFTDPTLRPHYVLGHITHKLSKHAGQSYTLKCKNEGRLFLFGVPEYETSQHGDVTRSRSGMRQTENFVKLLSSTDNLGAVGLPWDLFLARKLPSMVFSALADSISVILGCRFDQILNDHHAMWLWESLLDETIRIICSFPEFRQRPDILKLFTEESFRKHLWSRLVVRKDGYSHWISWIRNGHNSGVHFINGYFAKRAAELGVNHQQNSMALNMVKARQKVRRRELENDIPFGLTPYMMDGDKIGGGQIDVDPVLDDLEASVDL
ncbi:hypothetical protein F5X99DRAFT_387813 [Biscogniauxia marginata]|nr:hypothetical protein F5X99DRAFT_387813 [Biscogniauxia marginata]